MCNSKLKESGKSQAAMTVILMLFKRQPSLFPDFVLKKVINGLQGLFHVNIQIGRSGVAVILRPAELQQPSHAAFRFFKVLVNLAHHPRICWSACCLVSLIHACLYPAIVKLKTV